MPLERIDISQIEYVMQVYGSIVATPGVDEAIKEKCNKKIDILVDLLSPAVESLQQEFTRFKI